MSTPAAPPRAITLIVLAAALVLVIQAIHAAQSVLVSMLLALFFAILGTPPMHWLERRRVPSALAALLVVGAMVLVLLLVGGIVGASISGFYGELPSYQAALQRQVAEVRTLLASHGVRGLDEAVLSYVNPSAVMAATARLLGGLGSALSDIVLVVLTVGFVLLESASFPAKLRAVLGDPTQLFPAFTTFVDDVERYMLIKSAVSLATGLLVGGWLFVLGVDFPILWGFLAFLLNYVPNVGSTIAAVPAVLLALLQYGVGRAAAAAAGYMLVNFVLDNVIETRWMGRRLGLSTLVVFVSLVFWGSLLGPIGMILCVPLTMTLKFACERADETRWIAALLAAPPR